MNAQTSARPCTSRCRQPALSRLRPTTSGAIGVEYGLLAALVALAILGTLRALGVSLTNLPLPSLITATAIQAGHRLSRRRPNWSRHAPCRRVRCCRCIVCFAGLLTLLVLAALTDLRERRIPNWLTGGVAALYPVYLAAQPDPGGLAGGARPRRRWSVVVGLGLFARELIGGGDVKLIAALSLWAGLDHFALVRARDHADRRRARPGQPLASALERPDRGPPGRLRPGPPAVAGRARRRRPSGAGRAAARSVDQPPCPTGSPSPPAAWRSSRIDEALRRHPWACVGSSFC